MLPFNWFDCLLAAVLVAGLLVGRRHGISEELPRVLKWVFMVSCCAAVYGPLGRLFAAANRLDPFVANLVGYLSCFLVIFIVFATFQRTLGPKLQGTDKFGRTEYYLGMGSGMIRFGCVLMLVLAVLNARAYSPGELKANVQFQEQNFGSTVFPTLHSMQVAVFERSLSGSMIRRYLGFLLISPTHPDGRPHDEGRLTTASFP